MMRVLLFIGTSADAEMCPVSALSRTLAAAAESRVSSDDARASSLMTYLLGARGASLFFHSIFEQQMMHGRRNDDAHFRQLFTIEHIDIMLNNTFDTLLPPHAHAPMVTDEHA